MVLKPWKTVTYGGFQYRFPVGPDGVGGALDTFEVNIAAENWAS